MKIQELIDQKIAEENKKSKETRIPSGRFKPSLLGACYRRQWWAKHNEPQTNPPDARANRIFKVGHLFHEFVQQFYSEAQREVMCEDAKKTCIGYADIVTEKEVIDIKSEHSGAFHYRRKRLLCTHEDGTTSRQERAKVGDKVRVGKTYKLVTKIETIDIIEDRKNHWMQVCFYAICLGKEFCRMVYISKDDLCVEEYVIQSLKLWDLVEGELKTLRSFEELPPAKPRLYGGEEENKECEYCAWKNKCFKMEGKNVEEQKEVS